MIFFVIQSLYIVYKFFLYVNNFMAQHVVFFQGTDLKKSVVFLFD